MLIIRFRYKGKIHVKRITRNFLGEYIMFSKGKEYLFAKRPNDFGYFSWKDISKEPLPDEFFKQIEPQLEEIWMYSK